MYFFSTPVWSIFQLVWFLFLTATAIWLYVHYKHLVQGVEKRNLLAVLEKMQRQGALTADQLVQVESRLKNVEEEIIHHVQKVGIIRFNPFAETGGNQSFSLALLDTDNSGIVISSLHSRESTRIYAKPVQDGEKTDFDLSDEERQAIKKAKKIK